MTRALLYRRFGRWQEAYAQFVRASELNPQDLLAYISAGGAAMALRWWDEVDRMVERIVKHFPRHVSGASREHAVTLRLRGDVAAGNRQLENAKLQMPGDFAPLFYIPFWKHEFEQCRRLVTEAAKYSELQDERWDKELQLVFVTKSPFDEQAAREAEKRLEERLARPIHREQQGDLVIALSNVKMLLGKKKEALRIAEESVEQHPISEDAFANLDRLKRLAFMYLYAGENDRALQTFAKLVQLPNGEHYGELKYNPVLDGLRQDPRFEQILKQAQQPFPRL
jgi:tetratricopeptide (TPR) repeat protein